MPWVRCAFGNISYLILVEQMQLAVKMKQLTSKFFPLRATWPVVIETKKLLFALFRKRKDFLTRNPQYLLKRIRHAKGVNICTSAFLPQKYQHQKCVKCLKEACQKTAMLA